MKKTNSDMTNVCIPFPGFYESLLSSGIESEFEAMEIPFEVYDKEYDYHLIEVNVAKQWVHLYFRWVESKTGLEFTEKFETMISPREYNFGTDRVFVDVPTEQLLALFRFVNKDDLAAMAKRMFTSYDGFMSYYEPDYETWGPPETWDNNQWLAVFRALDALDEPGDERSLGIFYDIDFCEAVDDGYKGEKA